MECDTIYMVSEPNFSSSTMSKFGIDPIAQHVSFKIFWWCVWPFCYKFNCQNVTLNRFYLIKSLEHLRFFYEDFGLVFFAKLPNSPNLLWTGKIYLNFYICEVLKSFWVNMSPSSVIFNKNKLNQNSKAAIWLFKFKFGSILWRTITCYHVLIQKVFTL